MPDTAPWIALAATAELPILEAPVLAAAGEQFAVRTVALPYKSLDAAETAHWAAELRGAGGILLRSGYVTAALLDQLPDLKVVAVHGAGVDPVDLAAAGARDVLVTNTPGANADAVAEITLALMLALLRGIPEAAHKARHDKAWDAARHIGGELRGRRLGLIGFGRIGRRVASLAGAFGMHIMAHDPALSDREIADAGDQITAASFEPVSLPALLAASDIISLHAPSIPATRHMINARSITAMKPGAMIVNCARGALIDEAALAAALTTGQLGGAALDVLDAEPPNPASPIYGAPNLILTPHMAGSTHECLHTIAATAGADIVRVLSGKAPENPVATAPRRAP